jgi:hypothetical protein
VLDIVDRVKTRFMKIEYLNAIREIILYSYIALPLFVLLIHIDTAYSLLLLTVGGLAGYALGWARGIRTGEQTSLFREFHNNLDASGMVIVPIEETLDLDE